MQLGYFQNLAEPIRFNNLIPSHSMKLIFWLDVEDESVSDEDVPESEDGDEDVDDSDALQVVKNLSFNR